MGPYRVCVKSSLFGAAFGLSHALALESFKSRIRASCPLQSGHHDGLSRNARYELAPGGRERAGHWSHCDRKIAVAPCLLGAC